MGRKVADIEYRLILTNTGEYIKETNDDRIWIKTYNKGEAFWAGDLSYVIDLGVKICEEKHLVFNEDMKVECTMTIEESWIV